MLVLSAASLSGTIEPSEVLLALGMEPEIALEGLRVSLGPETTDEELEHFMRTMVMVVRRIRRVQEGRS